MQKVMYIFRIMSQLNERIALVIVIPGHCKDQRILITENIYWLDRDLLAFEGHET